MALDRLNFLYQEVIFDHTNRPHNRKKLENATHEMQLLNPSCGDMIIVQMVVKDDKIEDVGFIGEGCSISMASASMMTDAIIGHTVEEAEKIIHLFIKHVGGPDDEDTETLSPEQLDKILQDAVLLEGVKKFPARYKCATLAWKAVELGLHPDEQERLIEGLTTKTEGNEMNE